MFAHIAGRLTGPRVLEVGAGTRKATVGLTALGLEGGVLALFWNSGMLRQERAVSAIQSIYDDFALFDRDRPGEPVMAADFEVMQDPNTWPGNEIAAHPMFDYLGTSLFPWQQDFTAVEYGAFLRSTSYYQVLEPDLCERLLTAVATTIRDQFDDLVTMEWSTQCYDVRRS